MFQCSFISSWDEYDAETLMVDPEGTVFVVSKSADGNGRLYSVPAAWDSGEVIALNRRNGTTLQLNSYEKNPTAGDISPDGTEVLYLHLQTPKKYLHQKPRLHFYSYFKHMAQQNFWFQARMSMTHLINKQYLSDPRNSANGVLRQRMLIFKVVIQKLESQYKVKS